MSGTILVTGSASGIGRALYRDLVDAGYRPIGLDRAAGPGCDIVCDLASSEAVARAAEQIDGPLAGIALMLADPVQQGLWRHPGLGRDRHHGRPLRRVLGPLLGNHPHQPLTHFR